MTPTYSPFTNERSNKNFPFNTQISYELNNLITLQQQLKRPQTLTIHQLSSTITSSNRPTPTPTSDYTQSLAQSSNQRNHHPVLTVIIELLNERFPNIRSHPNPEPPENI